MEKSNLLIALEEIFKKKYVIPGVIYDSAIVSSPSLSNSALFPNIIESVINLQVSENNNNNNNNNFDLVGSWGSSYINSADRLLSTASALYMMEKQGKSQHGRTADYFNKGINWLESHHEQFLASTNTEAKPRNFELLYTSLLEKLQQSSDLDLNITELSHLRNTKIQSLGLEIYEKKSASLFFVESIVNDSKYARKLSKLQSNNGSLSASPSATSVLIDYNIKSAIVDAFRYLRKSQRSNSLITHIADYYYQDYLLSIYPFYKLEIPFSKAAQKHIKVMGKMATTKGISRSKASAVPRADVTALLVHALSKIEDPKAKILASSLLKHEKDQYFECYSEVDYPSIMTNLYIKDALQSISTKIFLPQVEKIINFVSKNLTIQSFYQFHWQSASQIIQISDLIIALLPDLPDVANAMFLHLFSILQNAVSQDRILTIEAAHALLALLYLHYLELDTNLEIIHILYEIVKTQYHTDLQISAKEPISLGKIVYCSPRINESYILSSLIYYNQELGF